MLQFVEYDCYWKYSYISRKFQYGGCLKRFISSPFFSAYIVQLGALLIIYYFDQSHCWCHLRDDYLLASQMQCFTDALYVFLAVFPTRSSSLDNIIFCWALTLRITCGTLYGYETWHRLWRVRNFKISSLLFG